MKTLQWMLKTEVGPLYLVASDQGLRAVIWKKRPDPMAESLDSQEPRVQILAKTVLQLREYFAGKRTEFDLPLDVEGTEFQKKVWTQLARIPYGKTVSYRDVARKIKNEKAVRAVGTANGRNPLSIVVPCHRVIAADGTLGGYAGGLPVKTRLLALEKSGPQIHSPKNL